MSASTTPEGRTQVHHPHRPGSARAALAYPDFRRMWGASFASAIGSWMQNVLLPLYVLDRTGSTTLVGVMVFAQLGPLLFLSIPAGVIADRFDRRRWLIGTQLVQLAFSAALAPLVSGEAAVWAIFLVALGVGVGNALNAPAWSAMLPTLVSKEDLPGSVALNSVLINGARVVGPIIVAVLRSAGVSVADVFLINAATYLFVVAALMRTTIPKFVSGDREKGLRAFASGLRIVRSRPAAARLLVSLFTFSLVSLVYVGLFAAVVRLNFGVKKGTTTYEWLYAVWGTGACLGGLAIGTVLLAVDTRRIIRWGFFSFAVFLALFAVGRTPLWAFIVGALLGFAYFATITSMNTVFQSRLAHDERGRVMALWFMSFGGTVPLGNMIFAPMMDAVGARWVLGIGALWAVFLGFYCDIERIDLRVEQQGGGHALKPDHTASLDEHGISAGE